jgi:lipoprotein NlpI
MSRSTALRLAARVVAKKAARKAGEDNKTESEDEEWGGNVSDAMIDKLGSRKEVEEDIRDHCPKREFAQRLENFSDAKEDWNPVMMIKNATQGFGAFSRDANYSENVRLLVSRGHEKGFCALPN